MLPLHNAIELTPSPSPPPVKDSGFHSSFLVKVPPRQQQGLFAPSECGDTTDSDSSDSGDNLEQQEDGSCLSVEDSADSIGDHQGH